MESCFQPKNSCIVRDALLKILMAKKTAELNYYEQQSRNEFAFRQMLKVTKPDLYVLFDLLETTGLNWFVIVKVIRALNNIAMGNGYGTVSIEIQKGIVTFVRGEESDRINETLIIPKKKDDI